MIRFRPLLRLPPRTYLFYARLRRAMTLGVRAAVFDPHGRVHLVRHTYAPGWYFPGGGIEPGETAEVALARELMEEGGIAVAGRPEMFGLYFNRGVSQRDHVALFVCRHWTQARQPRRNLEIAESRFFAPGALPDDATDATRRRLAEILDGAERSAEW